MPIYEYRCDDCGRVTSVFVRTVRSSLSPTCPRCHGTRLTKLVSRFAVLRSEESRLDSLADPSSLAGLDEDDPKSVAAWARRMGDTLGDDLGGDFRQAVEEMEAGGEPGETEDAAGLDGLGDDGTL
jgi:putative FmdB family regulatory protein